MGSSLFDRISEESKEKSCFKDDPFGHGNRELLAIVAVPFVCLLSRERVYVLHVGDDVVGLGPGRALLAVGK